MSDETAARRRTAPDGGVFDWLVAPDGTRLRVALWGGGTARRGTVLLLQGRREFIEKYYETIADLLDRGFAVATLDWRGQGLSDRLLPDRQRGHATDFGVFVSDMAQFVAWVREAAVRGRCPGPFLILAHSMGGHIAARYLAAHRDGHGDGHGDGIERAVLIAPMIGIRFGILPESVARGIARLALAAGRGERYALLQGPYSERNRRAEAGLLSSDPARLDDEILLCRDNPDLALGGVTFGWVAAAIRSIDHLRAPGVAEAIRLPLLVTLASRDQVVDNAETRRFAARMAQARVVTIADARHEILKERDAFRGEFWAAFDQFTA